MNELPVRPPAHANLPGALPGYFSSVHGALLLTSSSRIGHHSTISYRYACKTLVRLIISPLVSCSLVNELLARLSAHANLLGTLLGYFPHVNIALPLTYSSRIGHYSTILPSHIQNLDSLEYLSFGVWFARERATRTAPSACQPTGGFARLLPTRPRRITTDLQFSDRPSQHNLIPLRMQDLDSLEYFPFGVLFAHVNELPAWLPAHANLPGALLGYFPHVHIALPLSYSSRIGHYSTILPPRIQNLDSHEYFALGVWFACERATRTDPSACQPTGDFAGLLPARPRRITIDLQFLDRPL